nr:MAG TPA: hypothetical protein [Caudoviricetes sp.]
MGFQQLYTEQQVVNIVEQIGSRDMNYWLQAVDSVFLGIAPEIEILKAPITVALTQQHLGEAESWGGIVNNSYSYDLVEGKNYVVKATVGKINGETQELELSAVATLSTSSIKQPLLSFAVENDLRFTLEDKVHFELVEPYYTEGEDFSLVSAIDTSSKPYTWSYVTISSLIQKAPNTNLLKEPVVVTQEEIDAAGSRGVQKTLNKAIGLEIDKIYDLTIVQNGIETIVTAGTIDGKANAETTFSFPIIMTFIWLTDTVVTIVMYDGIEILSDEPVQADKAMIAFSPDDIVGAFELTSIKEHANLEDWTVPLVVTIDNPKKVPYDKYYKKTGSLFTSAGQTVKVTGSLVVDGQAKPFDVEKTTYGDTGAYYVECNITELDQSFTIADGAYSSSLGGAFPASYMTLEIDNAYPDGSPMSELRIDSITVS